MLTIWPNTKKRTYLRYDNSVCFSEGASEPGIALRDHSYEWYFVLFDLPVSSCVVLVRATSHRY